MDDVAGKEEGGRDNDGDKGGERRQFAGGGLIALFDRVPDAFVGRLFGFTVLVLVGHELASCVFD